MSSFVTFHLPLHTHTYSIIYTHIHTHVLHTHTHTQRWIQVIPDVTEKNYTFSTTLDLEKCYVYNNFTTNFK